MPTPRAPVTAMRLHAGYRAAAADSVPQEDRSVSLGALPVAKKQRRPQSAAGAAARSPHEVARARDTSPRGGARGGGGGATTPTHGPPALTLARESSPPRRLARRLSSGAHAAPLFQRTTSVLGPPTAWAASRRRRGRTGWNEVRSVHEPPRGPGAREASPSDSPAVATGDSRTGSRSSAAGQLLSSMPSSFFEESDIEPPRPPAQGGKHRRRSGQRRGGGRGSRTHGAVWTLWGRATPAAAVHSWRQRGRPWDAGGEAGAVPGEGAVGESSMQTSGSGGGSRGGQDLEGGALAGGAEGPRTAAVEHGGSGNAMGAARRDEFEVEEEEDDELEYGRSWCCRLRASNPVRLVCIRVVESTWFDRGILVVILASCVALALEQPHYYLLSEAELEMQEWVAWSSFVFFALFLVEFLLRVTAQGFWWAPAPYLADPFNRLDFFVLVVSGLDLTARVLSLGVGTATSISRALRVGRVLRPLRLVNKNAGMRVIVNALLQSVPAAFNVFLLSLLLFFIFGIIGVNMFAGVFYSCKFVKPRPGQRGVVACSLTRTIRPAPPRPLQRPKCQHAGRVYRRFCQRGGPADAASVEQFSLLFQPHWLGDHHPDGGHKLELDRHGAHGDGRARGGPAAPAKREPWQCAFLHPLRRGRVVFHGQPLCRCAARAASPRAAGVAGVYGGR